MAFPVKASRSQRPTHREPPQAMVRSITVLPARVPMPTDTCSCAASLEAPRPDATMTAASGTAPRTGRRSPPTSPGERISRRSSLPSEMSCAACKSPTPYTMLRKRLGASPSQLGNAPKRPSATQVDMGAVDCASKHPRIVERTMRQVSSVSSVRQQKSAFPNSRQKNLCIYVTSSFLWFINIDRVSRDSPR